MTDDWAIFTTQPNQKFIKKPKNSGKFFLMLISRVQRTFQETTSSRFYGHWHNIGFLRSKVVWFHYLQFTPNRHIDRSSILQVTTSFSTSYLFLISTLLQSNFNCTWSVVKIQIQMHIIWEIVNCFSWDDVYAKSIKRENCIVVVAPSRIPFLLMPLSFTVDFATNGS